jgi:hypothetical protein
MGKHKAVADEYLEKAKACVAQAGIVKDPRERAALLSMAQSYRKLSARLRDFHRRATTDKRPQDDN